MVAPRRHLPTGLDFDRALSERIRAGSEAKTVTAAGALVHALEFLGVKRIGFASPYVSAINNLAIDFLAEVGVEAVARSEVGEALVLSCTDMRSVESLTRLEQAVGKPVISSNQAMMFQAMQLAGIGEPMTGFGQLLERVRL